jgi:hypothetical protein
VPISSTAFFDKDAFPCADVTVSEPFVQPVKTSPVLLRRWSSAIRLSFDLQSESAQLTPAIALNSTRVSEPFTRRGWQGKP